MSNTKPTGVPLGEDRVLSVEDVCSVMGFCPETAKRFMRETGYALLLHRRLFILESSLVKFLHEQESEGAVR